MKKSVFAIVFIIGMISVMSGCVTEKYVNDKITQVIDTRIEGIEQVVAANRQEIDDLRMSVATLSDSIQDALSRAMEAGKLAEGKFLFEATISDDSVFFAFDKSKLSDEAKKALDIFTEIIKTKNMNVYVEIQGHTDTTGPEKYNLELGWKRAESVLNYLHLNNNMPLQRMNIFSYGESQLAVNDDRVENHAKNRRVTLVVMQ